ncbi:TerB family tellurite resistance protein [Mucilaginibacter limnophilus]|uniref:TerB family tellurite resistance protein n=1 Tax=Mucilaginibacter limnophilus TaxID=1932778 RepID=A0A437MLH3_9SPHI|nr:TerB family tellurite resistance protein [Mucilaginibacter limnophilus]RVT98455.1 TerB family tellurite resistance protein [Mucilaginibacter limnophilus]
MGTITKFQKFGLLVCGLISLSAPGKAQSQELQQLLLNIEKLTQFKAILSDMKTAYRIYQQGYGTISNLSKGNFDLHNAYLTGLMAVSPAVRNNPRVAQIVGQQSDLLKEYRRFGNLFRQSGSFSRQELSYIDRVFSQLVRQSNAAVADLTNVMTAGKLRMSDDDRLRAIDRLFIQSTEQLQFLRWFSRKTALLSLARSRDLNDTRTLQRLYQLH